MMNATYKILLLVLLLSSLQPIGAQGWEREYETDTYSFQDVEALPNGKFVFMYEVSAFGIANANGDLETMIPLDFESPGSGGLFNSNLIILPDGSVTGMLIKSTTETEFPDYLYWFNINPETGTVNWTNLVELPTTPDGFFSYRSTTIMAADEDGYYLKASYEGSNEFIQPAVVRTDTEGNVEWAERYSNPFSGSISVESIGDIQLHPEGGLIILASPEFGINYIQRVLFDGTVLSYDYLDFEPAGIPFISISIYEMILQPDGTYIIGGTKYDDLETRAIVSRIDAEGNAIWATELGDPIGYFSDIEQGSNGNLYLAANVVSTEIRMPQFHAVSPTGELLWTNSFPRDFAPWVTDFSITPDGGFILSGHVTIYNVPPTNENFTQGYLLRLGENGQIYNGTVEGYIFEDLDNDCSQLVETPLAGWLVAFKDGAAYYALTDADGRYRRPLNTGNYVVQIYPPNDYWGACPAPLAVSVPELETVDLNFPLQALVECPSMQVDISTPFLRRCFDATYTLTYCNTGTIMAEDAYVEVELDEFVTFVDATLPPSEQDGNLLRFPLNDVAVGECGTFRINTTVDCDDTVLGQTHCTTAHIYPDEICNASEEWTGASLEVMANCDGDSLRFTITNVGTAPTTNNVQYLVIEDQVILLEGTGPILNPLESVELSIAADGATYRMEVEQEPNHPVNTQVVVTVEGCGEAPGEISLGFVTQYWENDGESFRSVDCQENIGSYDPNDKRAFPKGYDDEHYIEANQELEYHIRFQNTGTDTAFTVIVRDQLAPELDITTLRPGASSHPYELELLDDRILRFKFNNILLVDSFANEPLSHGFVKFKIKQLPDLPLGTRIENRAAIFFDFNDPVYTNLTFHTIGEDFVTAVFTPEEEDEDRASLMNIYPNPFAEQTTIKLSDDGIMRKARFLLFDVAGRLIREEHFADRTLQFQRKGLPAGVYFYHLYIDGRTEEKGKLMIQY